MTNIPEINHCIPTPKAYWCYICEAHTTHDVRWVGSNLNKSKSVRWKGCGSSMFCPDEGMTWKYGLNEVGILLVAVGVIIAVSKGGIDIGGSELGAEFFCLALGVFTLLIGGMMFYYVKKWQSRSSVQKGKTTEQLESETMNHHFQPTYENSKYFNHWVSQFLPSDEVEQLHEKYDSGTAGEELESEAK